MAYSAALVMRVRQLLADQRGFGEKKMFGGLCFLLHGKMCVGVWQNALIARIGLTQEAAALHEPYVTRMDVAGRPMKGWVVVEPDGVESESQLRRWVELAIDFVSELPRT